MTSEQEKVLHFFDKYVLWWMRSDIQTALRGEAYLLAALGLVAYTEVLGGLRTGNLSLKNHSKGDFDEFLKYMGERHPELNVPGIDIYYWVRCGLVHQYRTKPDSLIVYEPADSRAVIVDCGGRKHFNVAAYRDHFFEGAVRYRDDLLRSTPPWLMTNFEKALEQSGLPSS